MLLPKVLEIGQAADPEVADPKVQGTLLNRPTKQRKREPEERIRFTYPWSQPQSRQGVEPTHTKTYCQCLYLCRHPAATVPTSTKSTNSTQPTQRNGITPLRTKSVPNHAGVDPCRRPLGEYVRVWGFSTPAFRKRWWVGNCLFSRTITSQDHLVK